MNRKITNVDIHLPLSLFNAFGSSPNPALIKMTTNAVPLKMPDDFTQY